LVLFLADGTNGDNFQDMLGSLIWLLMRLLEHPHGFKVGTDIDGEAVMYLAILWPCPRTEACYHWCSFLMMAVVT
jgi:hypothetical protein